jgi:RNA polymerase sigma-70 factor, ECF subfamily
MNPPITARPTDAEALRQAWGTTTDEVIVARLRAGETRLFEVLMRRHNQRLFRAARAIVRDADEAEDVMQEAYVQAFTKLEQFEGRAKFSTWLTRIAVHEALARVRRRRLFVESDAEPAQSAMPSPEEAASNHELVRALEPMIDALPEAFRTVFVLRAVEGVAVADCAVCLDIPEETVRTRYFRARRMLQQQLRQGLSETLPSVYEFHLLRCDRVVAAVFARIARHDA